MNRPTLIRSRWFSKGLLAISLLAITGSALAQVSLAGHHDTGKGMDVPAGTVYAQHQFVVKFQEGTSQFQALRYIQSLGLSVDQRFSSKYQLVISIPQNAPYSVEHYVRAFRASRLFAFAEVDPLLTPDYIPNDTRFNELWGMHNIGQSGGTVDADVDAVEAWDTARNHPSIVVAVCDDGFSYTHEDLATQFWTNPNEIAGNSVDDDNNGFVDDTKGWDFSSGDNDPAPQGGDSHGTHVMGTVAAAFDNNKGVAGIGPNIKVMMLRMYGGANPFMSALTNAVDYAWQNGAKVISVSYNIDGFTTGLVQAIQRADAADVVYCNSAGNNGQGNPPRQQIRTMANNVVFVAATTRNDVLAGFSNFGTLIEIAAPGVAILSTLPGNTYGNSDGTSMSTPLVAGMMGVIRSLNPSMTDRQSLDLMLAAGDVVTALNGKIVGSKRANLGAAVQGGGGPGTAPTGMTMVLGSIVAGGLASLTAADDTWAVIQSEMLSGRGQQAVFDLEFDSTFVAANVTGITFNMEAHTTGSQITLIIQFWNNRTGVWDKMRSYRMTGTDAPYEAKAGKNRSDYINGANKLKVRVQALDQQKRTGIVPGGFQLKVDAASASINGTP